MRIWCSESAGKRDFVDYLADAYDGKPILVCEVRNVVNAYVRNFTVANDPHSNKFAKAKRLVDSAVSSALKELGSTILILDDWYEREDVSPQDYFVIHKPEDSDPLFRLMKPDADMAKSQARAIDQWNHLRINAPEKLIVLGYEERVRDMFDIDPEGDGGVQLVLKPDFVPNHRFVRESGTDYRSEAARLFGGTQKVQAPPKREEEEEEDDNA